MTNTEIIALLEDLRAFVQGELDFIFRSYAIPGTKTIEDEEAAVEVARCLVLLERCNHAIVAMQRPDPLGEALNSGDGSYTP